MLAIKFLLTAIYVGRKFLCVASGQNDKFKVP